MDLFLKKFKTEKERKGRVEQFFELTFGNDKNSNIEIDLEIGCGHGHWLNLYSDFYPDLNCIGIDLISKRIIKSNIKKEKNKRTNLHFMKTSANDFLDFKPINILIRRTFIFFPDPWPKKKHHKRRLIQQDFLQKLKKNSNNTSQLFFRTDHRDYFEWTVREISNSPLWEITSDELPLNHSSYFQDLLPNFQTLSAKPL